MENKYIRQILIPVLSGLFTWVFLRLNFGDEWFGIDDIPDCIFGALIGGNINEFMQVRRERRERKRIQKLEAARSSESEATIGNAALHSNQRIDSSYY